VRRHASWEDAEQFAGSDHVGDEELLAAVEQVKPRVHVFGHIHSSYGTMQNRDTVFYNASLCDEDYEPIREPWVIDLVPQK
jgi:Icc-related predicted phosphoesterase